MLTQILKRFLYITGLITLWHFACMYLAIPEYLLPSPVAIAQTFYTNANLLSIHSIYTGVEVVSGIFLAIFFALLCGVIYTFCPRFERFLRPVLVVMQTMPSFLFMPFLLLWFGFGLLPKMIIVTLTGFFPITLAFIEGLKRPPSALVELESLFHATPFRAFIYLRLPAALPAFFTGLRWACLQGSVAVIAADWLGASHGLGYLILTSYSRLQIPLLFCCVIILIVYAHMLMRAAKWAEGRCVFWIGDVR
jgi:putative hydroxymethylpyrimidine transport system permease protein